MEIEYDLLELTYLHGYFQAKLEEVEKRRDIPEMRNMQIVINLIYEKIVELEHGVEEEQ